MSNTYRDTWLKLRKVYKTDKIRKTITIPVFSVNCGQVKRSLKVNTGAGGVYAEHDPTFGDFTNLVTIEAWIKPTSLPMKGKYGVIFCRGDIGANHQYSLRLLDNGNVIAYFKEAGVDRGYQTTIPVRTNEWTFISVTRGAGDIKLYVDGELDVTLPRAAALDAVGASDIHRIGGASSSSGDQNFNCFIDEVRLWNEERTLDQIFFSYQAPRNIIAGDSIDDTLKAYYKFNAAVGSLADTDSISGEAVNITGNAINISITDEDAAPLKYGASFICNRYTCAVGQKSSLIYPITKPTDADFMLCVAWVDDDDNTQRRRFWDLDGVDIHPFPERYTGDSLPETFYLEIWNIDGNVTANLTEAITIESSITSDPIDATDRTPISLLTPTGSSALAANFPLTNPILFDDQQVYT